MNHFKACLCSARVWMLLILALLLSNQPSIILAQSTGPAVDDNNVLYAQDVLFDGSEARLVSEEGSEFVGYWDGLETSIYWNVRVVKGGKAKIIVKQGVIEENAGSDYAIIIGDQTFNAKTVGTEKWTSLIDVSVGDVELKAGDTITVRVKPVKHAKPNLFMCLGSVRFDGDVIVELLGEDVDFAPVQSGKAGYAQVDVSVYYPAAITDHDQYQSLMMLEPLTINRPIYNKPSFAPRFEQNETRYRAIIDIPEGANVYGGGEVYGGLERTNVETRFWNSDNFAYVRDRGRRLYQTHPWMMVVRKDGTSFGIIADTTWRGKVQTTNKTITYTFDGEPFRVVILEGDTPQQVVQKLADLTGKMKLPPKWALGYQQCRWSYEPDSRVKEIADEFRKRKLPCDVIWMDIDYMDGFRVFTFDGTKFPNPKELNTYLNDRGFKGVWMIDPGVKVDDETGYKVYESGNEIDAWVKDKDGNTYVGNVWPGACVFPDYSRSDVRKWWAGLYKDYMATGISGVWNDMNEPAVFDGPDWTMPMTNQHAGDHNIKPGTHRQYHNVYGFLMVQASYQGIMEANPDKRPFLLTRSNYLGGQRYAATWTGDNKSSSAHMKMSVPMTLTLGLSGQPFNGPDLGGFSETLEGELWSQWIGFGTLFPFVRGHAIKGSNDKEPWAFGEEIEDISRVALERRYRLMPYFYTVFEESSRNGLPVMRPIFMADPTDLDLRNEEKAFLVGKDLLVIPRWAEDVKLPQDTWESVSLVGEEIDDEPYQADIKIRGGAIVPVGKVVQNTTENSFDPLTLMIALDDNGQATGTLYEDAEDGFAYQNGEFLRTTYHAQLDPLSNKVTVRIIEQLGNWQPADHAVVIELWKDGTPTGTQIKSEQLLKTPEGVSFYLEQVPATVN
ncbi:DUF5110 domain-containing protein [Planctomycetota bacterium]|nr:DUF5110 domain-containing protein [Planctomycetota bacterium]